MQLVLSGDRIIAHGENFLAMGGVVINTETGAKYENATVTESNGCPSDIDKVGYKYKAGVFVPCAPFAGNGNNNGYFMEVCESCATPRSSGIPIKGGLKLENMADDVVAEINKSRLVLLWKNASNSGVFSPQTLVIDSDPYDAFLIFAQTRIGADYGGISSIVLKDVNSVVGGIADNGENPVFRRVKISNNRCTFGTGKYLYYYGSEQSPSTNASDNYCAPTHIYGLRG